MRGFGLVSLVTTLIAFSPLRAEAKPSFKNEQLFKPCISITTEAPGEVVGYTFISHHGNSFFMFVDIQTYDSIVRAAVPNPESPPMFGERIIVTYERCFPRPEARVLTNP